MPGSWILGIWEFRLPPAHTAFHTPRDRNWSLEFVNPGTTFIQATSGKLRLGFHTQGPELESGIWESLDPALLSSPPTYSYKLRIRNSNLGLRVQIADVSILFPHILDSNPCPGNLYTVYTTGLGKYVLGVIGETLDGRRLRRTLLDPRVRE